MCSAVHFFFIAEIVLKSDKCLARPKPNMTPHKNDKIQIININYYSIRDSPIKSIGKT